MASSTTKPGRLQGVIAGVAAAGLIAAAAFAWVVRPWYVRWGATDAEVTAALPGDEYVPGPRTLTTKAVTIQASPEQIYPWLVQVGADKGGWYSHTPIEGLLGCPLVNTDRIHPEWQSVSVGDPVRMCPEGSSPPPYTIVAFEPNRYMIWGHSAEDGAWNDVYQFVLQPGGNGETRLVLRSRSNSVGLIWDVLEPGFFIMESGMLQGIKERAEALATSHKYQRRDHHGRQ